mgnify:FL=1
MKITIKDNAGDTTEIEFHDKPGHRGPIINRLIHDIENGRTPKENMHIKNVKHTKKDL